MNFIQTAVDRIYREVPIEILRMAFITTDWREQFNQVTLEERIRREIIDKILLTDCNIIGGDEVEVKLGHLPWERIDSGIALTIPLSETHGRKIQSVYSLEFGFRGTEPEAIAPGMPGGTGTDEVYLIGQNRIFTPINVVTNNAALRCSIENDKNLANINQKAAFLFGDLAVLAARGYIHNKLAISTNVGYMSGGQVDGRLRAIIDDYGDAFNMYRELLTGRWKKVLMLNDKKWKRRMIKMNVIQ